MVLSHEEEQSYTVSREMKATGDNHTEKPVLAGQERQGRGRGRSCQAPGGGEQRGLREVGRESAQSKVKRTPA